MATRATRRRKPMSPAGPDVKNSPKKGGAVVGERYLELVRACPLRVIRDEEEYNLAIEMLNHLSDRGEGRTPDETEYLLALAVFVERYEDEHDPIEPASGAQMLRDLVESREITAGDVAAGTGLPAATISDLMAGKGELGQDQIERLARFFEVKPSFFLDE